MKTLNRILFTGTFVMVAFANTFANSDSISEDITKIKNSNLKIEQSTAFSNLPNSKDDKLKNGSVSKIFSNILDNSNLIPEPIIDCFVKIPKSFEPNAEYGRLLDVEVFNFSKIEVKIFDKWGVQVAESTMKNKKSNKNTDNSSLQKLSISDSNSEVKFNMELNEGTYFYEIIIFGQNGEKISKEGEIRLLRTQRK